MLPALQSKSASQINTSKISKDSTKKTCRYRQERKPYNRNIQEPSNENEAPPRIPKMKISVTRGEAKFLPLEESKPLPSVKPLVDFKQEVGLENEAFTEGIAEKVKRNRRGCNSNTYIQKIAEVPMEVKPRTRRKRKAAVQTPEIADAKKESDLHPDFFTCFNNIEMQNPECGIPETERIITNLFEVPNTSVNKFNCDSNTGDLFNELSHLNSNDLIENLFPTSEITELDFTKEKSIEIVSAIATTSPQVVSRELTSIVESGIVYDSDMEVGAFEVIGEVSADQPQCVEVVLPKNSQMTSSVPSTFESNFLWSFGFITFKEVADAMKCIEEKGELCTWCRSVMTYSGRRKFVGGNHIDFDSTAAETKYCDICGCNLSPNSIPLKDGCDVFLNQEHVMPGIVPVCTQSAPSLHHYA